MLAIAEARLVRTTRPAEIAPRFAALINCSAAGGARSRARAFERTAMAALGPALVEVGYARRGGIGEAIAVIAETGADVVLSFGGDGTARTALELLSPCGVAVAPLPGGTLNRLSRNLYGEAQIERLLDRIARGAPKTVPGGVIGERRFFVASGYGQAMCLHWAREALRAGRAGEAFGRLREVHRRSMDAGLIFGRFGAQGGCVLVGVGPLDAAFGLAPRQRVEALEAAAATFRGVGDMIGLAPAVLTRAWRRHPRVDVCATAAVELASADGTPIPALLDGEFETLPPKIAIRYESRAGLVWA